MRLCFSNKFPGDDQDALGGQKRPCSLVSDFLQWNIWNVHQEPVRLKTRRNFWEEKIALAKAPWGKEAWCI